MPIRRMWISLYHLQPFLHGEHSKYVAVIPQSFQYLGQS